MERQSSIVRRLRSQALRVVGLYTLLAGAWIALSDHVLEAMISDPALLVRISMFKGGAFVLATAGLLYVLLRRIFGDTARALTALAAADEALREAQKLEALGRLAGTVAHDFNNLLHVIASSADLGLAALPAGAAGREDLEEIQRASGRATELTRQLLAVSRQQLGHPTTLDLNEVVHGLERSITRLLGPDIDLRVHLAPAPALVDVDALQLEQVISNLVVNARDAMPEGGALTISLAEVAHAAPATDAAPLPPASERHVRLAVTDTGTGIDDAVRARMFEPYFTTKEPGRGTGLGLATVAGLVGQHRGHLAVISSPGHGATFEIYLPRSPHPVAAAPVAEVPRGGLRGSETLLLVDDDAQIRETSRRVLSRHGYQVLVAGDAVAATEAWRTAGDAIALVISDVDLPGTRGPELAAQLTRARPGLKVLFVSGHLSEDPLPPNARALQKPVSTDLLLRTLRQMLEEPTDATAPAA